LGARRLSLDPFVVTNSGLLGTAVNTQMIVQVIDVERGRPINRDWEQTWLISSDLRWVK